MPQCLWLLVEPHLLLLDFGGISVFQEYLRSHPHSLTGVSLLPLSLHFHIAASEM